MAGIREGLSLGKKNVGMCRAMRSFFLPLVGLAVLLFSVSNFSVLRSASSTFTSEILSTDISSPEVESGKSHSDPTIHKLRDNIEGREMENNPATYKLSKSTKSGGAKDRLWSPGVTTTEKSTVERDQIPLPELVRANEVINCPNAEGLYPVKQISNLTADRGVGRKIPKIIHQTGETMCLTKAFQEGALAWSIPGYSFYFHDREAKMKLLRKYWPMFPQLQNIWPCLEQKGGAAIADIWRYIVLYEYGGVYTDMDNAPGKFFNESTIPADADGWFVLSGYNILSQYFIAISPKHPLMFFVLHEALNRLAAVPDSGSWYVPGVIGPKALHRAFKTFIDVTGDTRPRPGITYGSFNRSITVIERRKHNDYVIRDASWLRKKNKAQGWSKMNFTDYFALNQKTGKSCLRVVMDRNYQQSNSRGNLIPLPELVRTNETTQCSSENGFAIRQVVNLTADAGIGRKIPKIIHQTGEQLCAAESYYKNAVAWSIPGYSFYYHDQKARKKLFQKHWPMFPELQNLWLCFKNKEAAVRDIWSYLILYEYGGIYVETSTTPGPMFSENMIGDDEDGFVLLDSNSSLQKYFIAVSPKHPLMFLALHTAMERLKAINDTGNYSVPSVMGQSCLEFAYNRFVGVPEKKIKQQAPLAAGLKYGVYNRSINVAADGGNNQQYVINNPQQNMSGRNSNKTDIESNRTCVQVIAEYYDGVKDGRDGLPITPPMVTSYVDKRSAES